MGDGLRLFRAHPLAGVGLGGSTQAAREQTDRGRAIRRAQHVMPLTVASGLGIVGLALVAWLLAVLARLALGRGASRPERLALGLALLVIFVQSLFYAALFNDWQNNFAQGLGPGRRIEICLANWIHLFFQTLFLEQFFESPRQFPTHLARASKRLPSPEILFSNA